MIISYSKSFVILHLEKTGGTTVEKSISPYLPLGDLYLRDWQLYRYTHDRGMNEHATSNDVSTFLGNAWPRFNKFSTVRNPVDIMKSLFKFGQHIVENTPKGEALLDGAPRQYFESNGDPNVFVTEMLKHNYMMTRPQYERLYDAMDGMIVDLSHLDRRWFDITRYLGFTFGIPMIKHRVMDSSTISLSAATEDAIREHFAVDYEVFPALTGVTWK